MAAHEHLTPAQVARFHEEGLLVVPGFYDRDGEVAPVQRSIHQVIGQVMKRNGMVDSRPPFNGDDFDAGYQGLIAVDRAFGGEVYDAVKQLPAFVRLLSTPKHEDLFRQLRPGAIPGIAAGGYGIRIDNPGEDRFRAAWHQEYPAQLRSLDGIVFWSPLVAVTDDLGPIQFCPGSHRAGPAPRALHSGSREDRCLCTCP